MSDMNSDLDQRRDEYQRDIRKWHYVLETFWQLDYAHLVDLLATARSLDRAVEMANREREGTIAT